MTFYFRNYKFFCHNLQNQHLLYLQDSRVHSCNFPFATELNAPSLVNYSKNNFPLPNPDCLTSNSYCSCKIDSRNAGNQRRTFDLIQLKLRMSAILLAECSEFEVPISKGVCSKWTQYK